MYDWVRLSELRDFSIQYPGDIYRLGEWIVAMDSHRSTRTCVYHTTVNGLAGYYANMTQMSLEQVCKALTSAGFNLGATLESDGDATSQALRRVV